VERVQNKQVLITGNNCFRPTIDCKFKELVILRVTASLNIPDNSHFLNHTTQKPERVYSILQGNILIKLWARDN